MRHATLCSVALAVLATAGAFLSAPDAWSGETEPLPEGVLPSNGYPPIGPDPEVVRSDADLEAWSQRVATAAATSPAAQRRAELYLGAAEAVRWLERGAERHHDFLRRALASLAERDPLAALARLRLFELALDEAAPPEARAMGATAWAFIEWKAPLDATPLAAQRWALAKREIHARYPPTIVRLALLDGDILKAARWALAMAKSANPRWAQRPAELWERAAILAYRVGRLDVARYAARLAAERATDPEAQARLAFWRLHLEHGLLSPEGILSPNQSAPKPGYLEDLEVLLRGLAGNPHVGPFLLSAASSALHGRAYETALAVYRRALGDPVFVQGAWRQPDFWAGLLPAVMAALALERFDEAEELLAMVERIAGELVGEADGLRAEIKLKRVQAAERASAAPPAPPQPPEPEPAPPPPPAPREPGQLLLPDAAARADPQAPPAAGEGEVESEGGAGGGLWPFVVAALGALTLLLLLQRRRR